MARRVGGFLFSHALRLNITSQINPKVITMRLGGHPLNMVKYVYFSYVKTFEVTFFFNNEYDKVFTMCLF